MKSGAKNPATWAEYAFDDLRTAEWTLAASPPILRVAAFHAHESAEKYLKGFLVARGASPPRIHDLEFLLKKCVVHDASLSVLAAACNALDSLVEPARYPAEDIPALSEQQAREAIAHAAAIARIVAPKLK